MKDGEVARYGQAFKNKAVARLLTPDGAALEAVVITAAMNEAGKSAWCRGQGVYPAELDKW